jgi:hypothetical protein
MQSPSNLMLRENTKATHEDLTRYLLDVTRRMKRSGVGEANAQQIMQRYRIHFLQYVINYISILDIFEINKSLDQELTMAVFYKI